MISLRRRFSLLAAPAIASLCLTACDKGNDDADGSNDDSMASICETEDRIDDFGVSLAKTGERHTVTIADAMPALPIRGDNTWTVIVTDASGAAMDQVTVDARPWMPDHGHGSAVEETVTNLGDGEYEMSPLNLFMAGYWEVTLDVTDADGTTDEVMFAVCVE